MKQNLVVQSEDASTYTTTQLVVTTNVAVAPDGTSTADRIADTAVSSVHRAIPAVTPVTTKHDGWWTASLFVKKETLPYLWLHVANPIATLTWSAQFDLTTGDVVTVAVVGGFAADMDAYYEPAPNGYIRLVLRARFAGAAPGGLTYFTSIAVEAAAATYTGSGQTALIWGAQLVAASQPGDYAKTTGTAIGTAVTLRNLTSLANMVLWSEDFANASWTKNLTTINSNVVVAPDGTTTGDQIVDTAANNFHYVLPANALLINGQSYTLSVYAKPANRNILWLGLGGISAAAFFDVSTGTFSNVSAGITATIEAVPNGWYRCSITGVAQGTNADIGGCQTAGTASYAGAVEATVAVWGAQLQRGATTTEYVRTTASSRLGAGGRNAKQPQNLILRSEEVDNASWAKNNLNITANAIVAPDGTTTADALIPTTTTDVSHQINQTEPTIDLGRYQTFIVFAKAGAVNFIALVQDGTFCAKVFNISNGTFGSSDVQGTGVLVDASIIPLPNGWYLCSITCLRMHAASTCRVYASNADAPIATFHHAAADTTSALVYVWGADVARVNEFSDYAKSVATAIIPASTALPHKVVVTNLLQRSEEFSNAYWAKTNFTITADAVVAPDGTTTADAFTDSVDGGPLAHTCVTPGVASHVAGNVYTVSVYVKRSVGSWFQIVADSGAGVAYFDIVNNVPGAFISAGANGVGYIGTTMEPLPNGWYRCSLIYRAANSGTATVSLRAAASNGVTSYQGTGTIQFYLWGAQLNPGGVADYIKTVAAASFAGAGVPVKLFDQNLLPRSEEFDNAAWTKSNSTITANALTAPDGTATADYITDSVANAAHYVSQTGFAAGLYTLSVFAKPDTLTWLVLGTNTEFSWFDLTNVVLGTIQTNRNAIIEAVGNGWVRCSVQVQIASTADLARIFTAPSNASVTYVGTSQRLAIWGAQLVLGNAPGNYLKTVTVAMNFANLRNAA